MRNNNNSNLLNVKIVNRINNKKNNMLNLFFFSINKYTAIIDPIMICVVLLLCKK